jgi:hypothetical protein
MQLRYTAPILVVLKLAAGLAMLAITGAMMLGRIGVGIGAIGLGAVLVAALVSGAVKKRKLRAALAEIDAEYPSRRGD